MRIGMLTGGGDCPGLNAVIRAVVRKGVGEYGHTIVGYRHGWRGVMTGESIDLALWNVRGSAAARRHDPRDVAHESLQDRRRAPSGAGDPRAGSRRRTHRNRRRGHARGRVEALQRRREGRGRAEDHRQRSLRDRFHVRVPHCGADRDRRDRPPAHDRRESRPRDGRRGDGPSRGMDRDLLGHGRRRRHHLDPRRAVRHRRDLRAPDAPASAGRQFLDRRRGRGCDSQGRNDGAAGRRGRRLRARALGRYRSTAGRPRSKRAPGTRRG